MLSFSSLPLRIKTQAAPLVSCFLALAVGALFFVSSNKISDNVRQNQLAVSSVEELSGAKINLADTLIGLTKAINMKQSSVKEDLIQDVILKSKKKLVLADNIISDLNSDNKQVGDLKKNIAAYKDSYKQALDFLDIDTSMTTVYYYDCQSIYAGIRDALDNLESDSYSVVDSSRYNLTKTLSDSRFEIFSALWLSIILGFAIGSAIGRTIAKPVNSITKMMKDLASGNTSLEVPYLNRGDEIGKMAQAVQIFRENALKVERMEVEKAEIAQQAEIEKKQALEMIAEEFEQSVGKIIISVTTEASELHKNANSLSEASNKTSQQTTHVASATEENSAVVNTVAAATEELSCSIDEINQQVEKSKKYSQDAVDKVKNTDITVSMLVEAANQIGDVVKLIQEIAEQTNLLALNATIEAARSGEAGKGFAVVASEVKNLASQTGKATEEISQKISTVQNASTKTVTAIRDIGKAIEGLNEISASIASAVHEQSAATKEISQNVQMVAEGTGLISTNITEVTRATDQSLTAATDVLKSSNELSIQSDRLRSEVTSFLGKVRTRSAV